LINEKRLYSLFNDVVDIYSPSGKEVELTGYLSRFLMKHLSLFGCNISLMPVDESRMNIIIETPALSKENISRAFDSFNKRHYKNLFLGHIDTVAAYNLENYLFNDSNGCIYGLGTADMKGGCVAMIEAFLCAAKLNKLPESTVLALVVGEEENGDGTKALLETYGERRHAAMSRYGSNAIKAMLDFLLKFDSYIEKMNLIQL
jgi:acetylornithine deacetylase